MEGIRVDSLCKTYEFYRMNQKKGLKSLLIREKQMKKELKV